MSLIDEFLVGCRNVAPLKEGGQKKVFTADHDSFGQVVVKHGEYRFGNSLERISREVRLLRSLNSEYYPKNHELIVDPIQREFLIVEERLDAVELAHAMDRFRTDQEILSFARQLVSALRVIWDRNVVHRDLKPANIMVTAAGEPRVIDLGIARFLDDASLTATLAGCGPATPIYAAPEQLSNRKSMISVRTDFFLLGIMVFELVHKFHPFDPVHVGNHASLVENIVNGNHVNIGPEHDHRLVAFVNGTLHSQPYRRFRSVDQVEGALT